MRQVVRLRDSIGPGGKLGQAHSGPQGETRLPVLDQYQEGHFPSLRWRGRDLRSFFLFSMSRVISDQPSFISESPLSDLDTSASPLRLHWGYLDVLGPAGRIPWRQRGQAEGHSPPWHLLAGRRASLQRREKGPVSKQLP